MPHNTLTTHFAPSTTATLRAIYQDHKEPEHVGFNLLRQEGQKREAARAKRRSEMGGGGEEERELEWRGKLASRLSR